MKNKCLLVLLAALAAFTAFGALALDYRSALASNASSTDPEWQATAETAGAPIYVNMGDLARQEANRSDRPFVLNLFDFPAAESGRASFQALADNNTATYPATSGAVSPDYVMTVLNSQVRIQTRLGTVRSTVSLGTFWGPAGGGSGITNPRAAYDTLSGRWIVTACVDARSTNSGLLIGVSQTSDPTGGWYLYRIPGESNIAIWLERPSLGFNKDWIVVQVNVLNKTDDSFHHSNIYIFNKANLYSASNASFSLIRNVAAGASLTPAVTYDATANVVYLLRNRDGNVDGKGFLDLYAISGSVGSETLSKVNEVSVNQTWNLRGYADRRDFAPQLGSSHTIQTDDARIQNVVYRNGSLWAVQTVFLPAGSSPSHSAVQWWQISPAGTVNQFGRLEDATARQFFAYPSIAVNSRSDVLVGYSRFSADQYASANYAFRSADDQPGTLRADMVLKTGEASFYKPATDGRNHWGDTSATVVDPVNDLDFWTLQEYAALPSGSDRWGTWWGQIDMADPSMPPAVLSGISPDHAPNSQAVTLILNGASFNAGAQVFLGSKALTNVAFVNSAQLNALVPAGLTPGLYNVRVCNPNGRCDSLPYAFCVTGSAPSLTGLAPDQGILSMPNRVTFNGYNLQAGATLTVGGKAVTNLVYVSANEVSGIVPGTLAVGVYDVVVKNPDLQSSTLTRAYTVKTREGMDLYLTTDDISATPNSLRAGQAVSLSATIHQFGGYPAPQSVPISAPPGNVRLFLPFVSSQINHQADVAIYRGDPQQGGILLGVLTANLPGYADSSVTVNLPWNTTGLADASAIYVWIDPSASITETDKSNNQARRLFNILPDATDKIPPVVNAVTINGGTAQTTTSANISVLVDASDSGGSGLQSLYLVERKFNASAGQWVMVQETGWLPFTSTKSFTLSADAGMRYIQAFVADGAGNISNAKAQRIDFMPAGASILANQIQTYRIDMAGGETLGLNLNSLQGDADLYVWDPNGGLAAMSNHSNSEADSISYAVQIPGPYQVEVFGYTDAQYDLLRGPAQANGYVNAGKSARGGPIISPNNVPPENIALPPAPVVTPTPTPTITPITTTPSTTATTTTPTTTATTTTPTTTATTTTPTTTATTTTPTTTATTTTPTTTATTTTPTTTATTTTPTTTATTTTPTTTATTTTPTTTATTTTPTTTATTTTPTTTATTTTPTTTATTTTPTTTATTTTPTTTATTTTPTTTATTTTPTTTATTTTPTATATTTTPTATSTATSTTTPTPVPIPTLSAISPASGFNDLPVPVTLTGGNFLAGITFSVGTTPLTNVTLINANEAVAYIPSGMLANTYDVTAQNLGQVQSATLPQTYTVLDAVGKVDIYTTTDDIWTDPVTVRQGAAGVTLGVNIYRQGGSNVQVVAPTVEFYDGDPSSGSATWLYTSIPITLNASGVGSMATASFSWTPPADKTSVTIYVVIDGTQSISSEINRSNNTASRTITLLIGAIAAPPEINTLSVQSGANTTSSRSVSVAVTATDGQGGMDIQSMYLVDWEFNVLLRQWVALQKVGWIPYANPYSLTLAGSPGIHYIQAWVADSAGNISASSVRGINYLASDTIIAGQSRVYRFDITAPAHIRVLPTAGDPDLYVWDSVSNLKFSNSDALTNEDVVIDTTGTYQVEVYGYMDSTYVVVIEPGSYQLMDEPAQNGPAVEKPPKQQPAVPPGSLPINNPSVPFAAPYRVFFGNLQVNR